AMQIIDSLVTRADRIEPLSDCLRRERWPTVLGDLYLATGDAAASRYAQWTIAGEVLVANHRLVGQVEPRSCR
ncbi:MAG: hypothetical protein ACR2RE_19275, partial [Geminicoccaceae bacterium]